MEVEFLELTDNTARFIIRGLAPSEVNAVRRKMIQGVPKMAIHEVDFHHGPTQEGQESISAYFDEIIAHRLGLVPIPTDLELFTFRDECVCEGAGCPNCTITYSLNKSGPATVYSGDLHPVDAETKVVDELIPITKLKEDQSMLIYAKAELGNGSRHAKWQAVVAAGYKFKPVVTVNEDLCDSCKECVDACPKEVLTMADDVPYLEHVYECNACKTCAEVCENEAISVEHDESEIIFQFETDGALKAREVIEKAIELLENDYEKLEASIGEL